MSKKYYTTPAGYRRLLDRIKTIEERYDAVVATNDEAAEAGDSSVWHDNFAYEENQRQMHQWAQRYHSLKKISQEMVIIDLDLDPEKVRIGCKVVIYDLSDDEEKQYTIAGYEDGDPDQNRISYTSPLAQALIGAEEGDLRKFKRGDIIKELEVVSIEPLKEELA